MMDRLESFDNDELMQFVKEPRIQMLGIGGAGNNNPVSYTLLTLPTTLPV